MNSLFSLLRVKSLKLFVILSACNLLIPSAWAEDACGVVTTACPTLNIPYSPQEGVVGTIGNGFDSDRDRYKPMRCLNGTETTVGGGTSTLSATKISSYEELLRKLEITVGSKIKFAGIFSAERSVKFVNETRERSFSQSFTFAYDVKLDNASFGIDPSNPLNDTGKTAAANSCRFREVCGDQFVYQIERGASLYVNLQFAFSSEYHKREFELKAKAGVEGVIETCKSLLPISASIEASIKYLTEYTRKDGVMYISALQVGGNVEQLARIFGTSGDVPAMSCSLDNLSACSKALDEIVKYAASSDFSTGVRQHPTNLKYHYGSYWEVSPTLPRTNIEVTPEIEKARTDLAIEYAKRLADSDRASNLLSKYTFSAVRKQQLTNLKDTLSKDVVNLRDAASICFSDLANCLAKKCQVFSSLVSYSEDAFKFNINDGLVLHLPLDGNANDMSGNGNNGIAYNITPSSDRFGNPNNSYSFSGSNSYIEVRGTPSVYPGDQVTFSAWVKLPSNLQAPWATIVQRKLKGHWYDAVLRVFNGNEWQFVVSNGQAWKGVQTYATQPNSWHHLVGIYSNSIVSLYVDNLLVGYSNNQKVNGELEYINIGRYIDGTGTISYLKGEIDDVRVYNRALSASEVQALYQMSTSLPQPAKLTVAKQGEGTISAQGINCGTDCEESYPLNQIVPLTATPATDYTFTSWQGCAIVTTNVCQVTVDAAKTVTATFTQKPVVPPPVVKYTLTINKQGEGSVSGTGIDCGTDCTESLVANTTVTLTATPAANFTFAGWDGCTSSNNVCQITLNAAKSVTAKFTAKTVTPPPVEPPVVELKPECVPLHAIYTDGDKTLKVPLFEIPMIALVGGVATNKVESYSVTFKSLYDTQHFLIKNVAAPTVEKVAGCAVATYNPETGILSLPYVDVPIMAKLGNTKIETQRLIFQASLHWMPMLGNNIFVVENITQLQ